MVLAASEFAIEVRAAAEGETAAEFVTGLAVHQADRWVAIALQLGTVAEGDSAEQALDYLEAAVRDAMEIAAEESLPRGAHVTPEDLKELLRSREPLSAPVTMRAFAVRA